MLKTLRKTVRTQYFEEIWSIVLIVLQEIFQYFVKFCENKLKIVPILYTKFLGVHRTILEKYLKSS